MPDKSKEKKEEPKDDGKLDYEKLNKMYDLKKKLINTTEHEYTQAYVNAAEEHLKDEKGRIDYEKLDNVPHRKKFAKAITDHMLKKAREAFKSEADNDFHNDLLFQAHTGITKTYLIKSILDAGSDYTHRAHAGQMGQYLQRQSQAMDRTIYEQIRPEHLEDLVKYVKADNLVDTKKFSVEDAQYLLGTYFEHGAISKKHVKGKVYAKPEDKKAEAKAKKK